MFSALLAVTFPPDFEYFIRLEPDSAFGHTPAGVFVITLPLALAVLALGGCMIRAVAGVVIGGHDLFSKRSAGQLVAAVIPLTWWEIVALGLFLPKRAAARVGNELPTKTE